MLCNLCPRNCNIDRDKKVGFCKVKGLKINKVMLHYYEEPIISGSNGSGAIFFSGCNLKCIFCQNYQVSHFCEGIDITVDNLVEIFKKLEQMGANNINLVTPTQFTLQIISALDKYRPKIPIIFNTSGYEKCETIEMLKNYADIFIFDIKYYSSALSKEYSSSENYFDNAIKSLVKAREILPEDIIENGLMRKGIIVRHLVLPGSSTDSIKVLDEINKNLGNKTIVSLMSQYTPFYKAKDHPVLKNRVKDIEYKRVVKHLINLGFENAYTQEKSSSNECFIPDFEEEFNLDKFLNKK